MHVIARIAARASRTTLQPVAARLPGGSGQSGGARSPGAPAARRRGLGASGEKRHRHVLGLHLGAQDEALQRARPPGLQAAPAELHRQVREHRHRQPPAEAPGGDGLRHRPGDLRARRLVLPHVLRTRPPRPPAGRGVRLQVPEGVSRQLPARQPGGHAARGKALRPARLHGVPQPAHQQPALPRGRAGPGQGRPKDLGRRRPAQQGPDQAEGRPDRSEGLRVSVRGRALDEPHVPSSPLPGRRRGARQGRAGRPSTARPGSRRWRSGRA